MWGSLSTIPITRDGLGLLDAEFSPLICTDRVKADIVDKCFLAQRSVKRSSGSTVILMDRLNLVKKLDLFL